MKDRTPKKRPLKTRIFNFFRIFFTNPTPEKWLVSKTLKSNSIFLKKLTPSNYLYKKKSIRTVNRNGINYKFDISNFIENQIYFGHKFFLFDNVLNEIKSARTILDIGANIGATALFFANENPNARIIGFEPHPDTFKDALVNLSVNDFENIELHNFGLGTSEEELKLYEVNPNNPGMNRIISSDVDLPYKLIKIKKLTRVISEKGIVDIDFIKIDVEGYEYEILEGAKEILNSKPTLYIELDDTYLKANNRSAKELISLLFSIGYTNVLRATDNEPITSETDLMGCHIDIVAK